MRAVSALHVAISGGFIGRGGGGVDSGRTPVLGGPIWMACGIEHL